MGTKHHPKDAMTPRRWARIKAIGINKRGTLIHVSAPLQHWPDGRVTICRRDRSKPYIQGALRGFTLNLGRNAAKRAARAARAA